MVEIIGIIGSVILLISMLFKSMLWLRIVNIIGSVVFAVYGFLVPAYSTAAMNIIMVVINIGYIIALVHDKNKNKETASSAPSGEAGQGVKE